MSKNSSHVLVLLSINAKSFYFWFYFFCLTTTREVLKQFPINNNNKKGKRIETLRRHKN